MEQVLALYSLPYNPKRPVICVDERPCQLIEDKLVPMPMEAGRPKREDYEYKRKGVCTVFIAFEPHTGFRITETRDRRTKQDYAAFMQKVAQHPHFAECEQIVVVQDNLNTHNPGSFYTIMPAEEAYAFGQRFEMVYTPHKASWLNMAEIEFSVLARQCLNRRIGDEAVLEREVRAWTEERNLKQATVHWQFTLDKARDKFQRFYPELA